METGKLRLLLCLEIHLCMLLTVLPSLQGQSTENVIDLLAALNMSHPIKGISKIQDDNTGPIVYKLRPKAPHLTLPREYSHFLVSTLQGTMGLHLAGRQTPDSSASLFSFSSQSSSILQIFSSTRNDTLRLDYRAATGAQGRRSLLFPGGNPFSGANWVQLALSLEPDKVTLFLHCEEAVVIPRKREERINLGLPQDLVVTLASIAGETESKLSGYLKTAEISMRAYTRRPWYCANITEGLPTSVTHAPILDSSDGRGQDIPNEPPQSHYALDVQKDQPQRGVALGPPGHPQGGRVGSRTPEEEKLRGLEERLEQLAQMLDMVKAQNADLQSRVQHLEGCDCVRRRCVWEGRDVEEGHQWQTHLGTVCTCASGQVTCEAGVKASFQMAAPLLDPCISSPCQNGGLCLTLTSNLTEFRCSCPPNTKGPVCHSHLRQVSKTFEKLEACWEPRPENNCQGSRSFQRRWAFNPISGLCEDFLYCSGNNHNNFPSQSACAEQCVLGACCVRKPIQTTSVDQADYRRREYNASDWDGTSIGLDRHLLENESWYKDVVGGHRDAEAVGEDHRKKSEQAGAGGCDEDSHFLFTCEYVSRPGCQALLKDLPGGAEVVSFSPGEKCSEVGCSEYCGCLSHQQPWRDRPIKQGAEECAPGGKPDCVCSHTTRRKEIRDLTVKEMKLYQRAIRRLHTKPATWAGFAQLRAEFSPQAGHHAYFLPWHRYFLRLLELELQSLTSCQLAIPYFDWTVDSGSMQSSTAWQADAFGGDGEPGTDCVRHHPFGRGPSRSRRAPCLRRRFNSSVWLPDAVTFQMALNLNDFQLFSQSLQTFSGLFRLWVGGHMGSPLAAFDPLYLSHMAFMDKMWTQWQEKHQHTHAVHDLRKEEPGPGRDHDHRPAPRRHAKMKPFDVTPDDVMSSQDQLCVVYVPITIGAPCNVTASQTPPRSVDSVEDQGPRRHENRGFGKRSAYNGSAGRGGGFNSQGYDGDGYDRSGRDRGGYGRDGFNRDFIDREGYNVFGFNRYGLDRSNVSWFGVPRDRSPQQKRKRAEHDDGEEEDEQREEAERRRVVSELFYVGGYSAQGFDPFGLDRGGFDPFGFRRDGYDKDNCNWFFNGPHYLRFYFHTQQQLLSSSADTLRRITRTCPPISPLPPHWATQDWMSPDPPAGDLLIGQLSKEEAGQEDTHNDDSVTEAPDRMEMWLPVTPDDRLCFKLYWFSGCPLGAPPITCPDLCRQASCHGYPEAVCHMHNCGSCFSEWLDPATGSYVICNGW